MKLIKLPNGDYVAPDNVAAIRLAEFRYSGETEAIHPARVILDLRTGATIVIEAQPGEELQALADRIAAMLGEGER